MFLYIAELLGYFHVDRPRILQECINHPLYAGNFARYGHEGPLGEYLSVVTQTFIYGFLLYCLLAGFTFVLFFKAGKQKFLPKLKGTFYILHDMKWAFYNLFFSSFVVSLIRLAQPRYGFIYYNISDYGWPYLFLSILLHLIWDETLTYWAHRWLHTYPRLYMLFHRHHHYSKDVTPFAGFAFHPIDALLQGLPLFLAPFIFPEHIFVQLGLGFLTTTWAISIHDNVPVIPIKLFLYSTHHTIHHEPGLGQLKNFGKFTTVMDRLMGTYEDPDRINFGWDQQNSQLEKFKWFNDFYEKLLPSVNPKAKKLY